MTTVGHSLIGFAIRVLLPVRFKSKLSAFIELNVYAAMANIHDFPLPLWGHKNYKVSHSIFVLPVAIIILFYPGLILLKKINYSTKNYIMLWCGILLAVMSHYFLDTLYSSGGGLAMLWPFSNSKISFPLPFLHQLDISNGIFCIHNIKVFVTETMVYGIIFILCIIVRRYLLFKTGK